MNQTRLEWLIRHGDMLDALQQRELLFHLGHFGDLQWGAVTLLRDDAPSVYAAVKSYQRFSSEGPAEERRALAIDGEFGPLTRRSVRERFCACPDILPSGGSYWNRDYATGPGLIIWHDMDYTDQDEVAIYKAAMASWTSVSGLKARWFREGDPRANIWSRVRRIDGPGKVLGWSMLPPANAPGTHDCEQRMDIADTGNLMELYAHELGHAIGHGHYPNGSGQRYLMNPYLQPGIRGPQGKEITLTQQMYGQPDDGGGGGPVDPPPSDDIEVIGRQRIGEVGDADLWMVHQLEPRR